MSALLDHTHLLQALAIPAQALVRTRVPKKLLLEQGLPTAADKRAVQEGLNELWWVAALKPQTCGLPAHRDAEQDHSELAVLSLLLRPNAKVQRLLQLIHRAIPYPVLLVVQLPEGPALSLAVKRASQAEKQAWVVEAVRTTPPILPGDATFLQGLALHAQQASDLRALYHGWLLRVEALHAARLTGHYHLSADAHDLRDVLDRVAALDRDLLRLRNQAKRERQMNRAVQLNLNIKQLEAEQAALIASLHG
jgi:hypothetical protein